MRQRFNRSFCIRRTFSSRADCLFRWLRCENHLQLHIMCQFKSNCSHFKTFNWQFQIFCSTNLSLLLFNFKFKESKSKRFKSNNRTLQSSFNLRSRDLIDWLSATLRRLKWPKTRRRKKRNKSVNQFAGCPAALPAGNSAPKRPMDQSCPGAAPDSRQLSRPTAPTAIDCHFQRNKNWPNGDCFSFTWDLKSNLLVWPKRNVLSPEFRTHSGSRNRGFMQWSTHCRKCNLMANFQQKNRLRWRAFHKLHFWRYFDLTRRMVAFWAATHYSDLIALPSGSPFVTNTRN